MAHTVDWDRHDSTFKAFGASLILTTGEDGKPAPIAKLMWKHGEQVTLHLHVLSFPMVRAVSRGYGYDKKTALVEECVAEVRRAYVKDAVAQCRPDFRTLFDAMTNKPDGQDWQRAWQDAGFTVVECQ